MNSYFQMKFDSSDRMLCLLDDPLDENGIELNAMDFTEGKPYYGKPPATIPFCSEGEVRDVMFGVFDMLVVSSAAMDVVLPFVTRNLDVQVFPVTVHGSKSVYYILNLLNPPNCFDEENSEFDPYVRDDADLAQIAAGEGGRPRRFETVYNLRILPDRVQGRSLFTVLDWEVVVVVSNPLREALLRLENPGVLFSEV